MCSCYRHPQLSENEAKQQPKRKGRISEQARVPNIMVDCLFLSEDVVRIQAHTDVGNTASQNVIGKAGFKREGTLRKIAFVRGEGRDFCRYSIL